VRGRDRERRIDAERREVCDDRDRVGRVGLVHSDDRRLPAPPHLVEDPAVAGQQALARIAHEDDRIGLVDRGLGLAARELRELVAVAVEPPGVDHHEGTRPIAADAVVAVARDAGAIGDDRVTTPGQLVEQRRLADVRPADQRDDRQHPTSLRRTTPRQPPIRQAPTRPSLDCA
jgi:hypothetical protein